MKVLFLKLCPFRFVRKFILSRVAVLPSFLELSFIKKYFNQLVLLIISFANDHEHFDNILQ